MKLSCKSRSFAVCVSFTVALVLLGMTAYLFSGLHTHSRLSAQPCAFHAFESSPVVHAANVLEIPRPLATAWVAAESGLRTVAEVRLEAPIGRTPPAL